MIYKVFIGQLMVLGQTPTHLPDRPQSFHLLRFCQDRMCIPTKSATDSNRKPATIPTWWRPAFQSEAGHRTDPMSAGHGCW